MGENRARNGGGALRLGKFAVRSCFTSSARKVTVLSCSQADGLGVSSACKSELRYAKAW